MESIVKKKRFFFFYENTHRYNLKDSLKSTQNREFSLKK